MDSYDAIIDRLALAVEADCGQNSSDFDLNGQARVASENKSLTPAAVLVGLVERDRTANIILTRRTRALKHHPGQVAFPGGKQDPGDQTLIDTALREATEEVGLDPKQATIIGAIPRHETVTGFDVEPVVARISPSFTARPEAGEVEQVFEVPFLFLMDRNNFRVESRMWRGSQRNYFTIPYGPHYIWGATARMIVGLRDAWENVS